MENVDKGNWQFDSERTGSQLRVVSRQARLNLSQTICLRSLTRNQITHTLKSVSPTYPVELPRCLREAGPPAYQAHQTIFPSADKGALGAA